MDLNLIPDMKIRRYQKVPGYLKGLICSIKWLWLIFILMGFVLTAIAPASDNISIAVIDLNTSPNLSNQVGEEISGHIRTHLAHLDKFDVMDKDEMNDIINKQGFLRPKGCKKIECHPALFETHGTLRFLQKCGASDHDAALEIGWILGVKKILIGLVNKLDERYTISVKIIDTFTREVEVADQISFHYKIQDIEDRIEELAARLAVKISVRGNEMDGHLKEVPHITDNKGDQKTQKLNLEGDVEIQDMKDFVNIVQEKMGHNDFLHDSNRGEEGSKPKPQEGLSGKWSLIQPEGMVFIPAGPFTMGSGESEEEGPIREVYVDAFYIDKYEVTNTQYERFRKSTGHRPPLNWGKPDFNGPDQPVTGVSWEDAADYASWAGKRLPTEAEWEKAARGTDGRLYPWGNKWSEGRCRSGVRDSASNPGPASVGSHTGGASPYGCQDMAGNAWEWCADWFMADYYNQAENRNPKGPQDGSWHVLRGGGWDSGPEEVRATFRQGGCPDGGYRCAGFRCVKELGEAGGGL